MQYSHQASLTPLNNEIGLVTEPIRYDSTMNNPALGMQYNIPLNVGTYGFPNLIDPNYAQVSQTNAQPTFDIPLDVPSFIPQGVSQPFEMNYDPNLVYNTSESPRAKRPKIEAGQMRCTCQNTSCLKCYCVCFKAGRRCTKDCACANCKNRDGNEDEIKNAMCRAKEAHPGAFEPKTPSNRPGCKCKRECKKNYCECKKNGYTCQASCGCTNCQNGKPGSNAGFSSIDPNLMLQFNNNDIIDPTLYAQETAQHNIQALNGLPLSVQAMPIQALGGISDVQGLQVQSIQVPPQSDYTGIPSANLAEVTQVSLPQPDQSILQNVTTVPISTVPAVPVNSLETSEQVEQSVQNDQTTQADQVQQPEKEKNE